MGLFDVFKRGREGGPAPTGPIGMGADDSILDEPGEGGPSIFMPDLAALRWAAQHEAVNVGRVPLEPEQWEDGRMAFPYERQLAHDHEGIRDRLSDFVSAESRTIVAELYEMAGEVAAARDHLRETDREYAVLQESWNRSYREVYEDELELGRYFRLKSKTYQLFKWLLAAAIFGAELAISIALFSKVVSQDIAAMPVLFAMGLILILMVVPHYSAIGIKEGVTKYHQAELDAYEKARVTTPSGLRKKAQMEEVEDRGAKLTAGIVGMVLVVLFVPLSALRAQELGGEDDGTFWFWFFLLVQFAISGYFFLREWWDYGTASANLKHHDHARDEFKRARARAFEDYTAAVSEFMARAQDLLFLYRQAPRWDSYIVQSYLATVQHFRHLVTLQNPELDVFVKLATVPTLSTVLDGAPASVDLDPVEREHPELAGSRHAYSRGWWMEQAGAALVDSVGFHSLDSEGSTAQRPWTLESPERLLAEILERYFGLTHPYVRPRVLDHVEEIHEDGEPGATEDAHPSTDEHVPLNGDAKGGAGLLRLPRQPRPSRDAASATHDPADG